MAVIRQLFAVYVAANMALCALLFAPWVLPRETISGLLGRWLTTEVGWRYRFAWFGVALVDRLYWWEPRHCFEVFILEHEARRILYP